MKLSKSLSKQTKGAITVFISIVFSSVFLVVGVFTDGARLKLAQSQIERAGKTALSSVLACYQNDLKDEYGLFGLYIDNSELQENYEEYLLKNLNIYNHQNYLYDYSVEDINISSTHSLLDKNIFERQIMEFVKYRAPYEIASSLVKKVDGIKNISSGAKVYKRILETDGQADEIGTMQLSLEEGIGKINTTSISSGLKDLKNDYASEKSKISEYNERLTSLLNKYIKEKDKKIKSQLSSEIEDVQGQIADFENTKNNIKDSILNYVNQYKSINSEARNMALAVADKKEKLLDRIKGELQYTGEKQEGVKELLKTYEDSLKHMQNIINQDNSSEILSKIDNHILACDGILDSVNNETDFSKGLDNLPDFEKITYTFNKSKPEQSEDDDNRNKVQQALKEALDSPKDLKTIDPNTFAQLPSQMEYVEDNHIITWDNMDFTNTDYAAQNLDYLSQNQSQLENIAETITEELFLNEYIMGTFKHGVPVLAGESEKDAYNLRSMDKAKRDSVFSAFEVEYIINGNKDEGINKRMTQSEILAIRLMANVIHIYTDASKMTRTSSLAAALSAWSAGLSTPLIQTTLIFSWAMLESLYDMKQLEKGEKVMLFKTEKNWKTDISGTISKKKTPDVENNPLNLSYHDYLKVFLLMMDKNKKLARVQDLVQLNTSVSNPGFMLENCKAGIEADTAISIKNLFVSFASIPSSDKSVTRSYIQSKLFMGY